MFPFQSQWGALTFAFNPTLGNLFSVPCSNICKWWLFQLLWWNTPSLEVINSLDSCQWAGPHLYSFALRNCCHVPVSLFVISISAKCPRCDLFETLHKVIFVFVELKHLQWSDECFTRRDFTFVLRRSDPMLTITSRTVKEKKSQSVCDYGGSS